jgi:hypothetical protein
VPALVLLVVKEVDITKTSNLRDVLYDIGAESSRWPSVRTINYRVDGCGCEDMGSG